MKEQAKENGLAVIRGLSTPGECADVEIDPTTARALLLKSVGANPRNLSPAVVGRYAKMMHDGDWSEEV